ncbi:GNAT family N-acetyltransferase [uncultured Cedecea sp.]|uniref:GNAT family N-acetyltransferase n=1 Tax=uncultured Cedecea sp. TaxID=988762 RepID=UPI0026376E39|nr:GNAT family N-acetyltransferase [uncultured Cedecea sp.]
MIETARLILRQWQASDLEPFAELNADPDVMRYFPAPLSREESDNLANRFKNIIEANKGWGFWAVELKTTGEFVGTVGLLHQAERFAFSPCTEIGWRLAKNFWHQGIALEAATCALNFAFNQLYLDEIVAFTAVQNTPSEGLMKRLGMVKQPSFMHPALAVSHVLAKHRLYKITRTGWLEKSI